MGVLEEITLKLDELKAEMQRIEAGNASRPQDPTAGKPYKSYTVKAAAELLSGKPYGHPDCLTDQTIRKWINIGRLKVIPGVRPLLIPAKSIQEFVDKAEFRF